MKREDVFYTYQANFYDSKGNLVYYTRLHARNIQDARYEASRMMFWDDRLVAYKVRRLYKKYVYVD